MRRPDLVVAPDVHGQLRRAYEASVIDLTRSTDSARVPDLPPPHRNRRQRRAKAARERARR